MTKKPTHPNKVFSCVIWGDAHSRSEQQKDTDIKHEVEPIQTYGWVIRSDEVGVTVAGEWLPDDKTWRDTTFVPRAMVMIEIPLRLTGARKVTRTEQKEIAT